MEAPFWNGHGARPTTHQPTIHPIPGPSSTTPFLTHPLLSDFCSSYPFPPHHYLFPKQVPKYLKSIRMHMPPKGLLLYATLTPGHSDCHKGSPLYP